VPAGFAATFTFCICIGNYFHPRFLMPIIPLVFLCLAYRLRLREKEMGLPTAILAILLAIVLNAHITPNLPKTLRVAPGISAPTDFLRAEMPDYAVTEFAGSWMEDSNSGHVPANERILVGTYANNLAYYQAEALWPEWWEQDSIHYENQEVLEKDLRRLGV